MSWHIIIDQIATSGKSERYEYDSVSMLLPTAIEDALKHHHLVKIQQGMYQITAGPIDDPDRRS